jgi:CBS domain containing-hemolysin-like protein
MNDSFVWLAILLTLASLYFGAATLALRDLSRIRLEDVLERRGRQDRLEGLIHRSPELMMGASILRLIANVGLILVTIALFSDRIHNVYARYATVLAVAGGVVLVFGVGIPNAWAKYAGEELVAASYLFLTVCRIALKPAIMVLRLTDEIVRRLVGAPRQDELDEAEQIEQEPPEPEPLRRIDADDRRINRPRISVNLTEPSDKTDEGASTGE